MTGTCYECGATVSAEARAEFQSALEAFAAQRPDLSRRGC
jgi:hypothetical protein